MKPAVKSANKISRLNLDRVRVIPGDFPNFRRAPEGSIGSSQRSRKSLAHDITAVPPWPHLTRRLVVQRSAEFPAHTRPSRILHRLHGQSVPDRLRPGVEGSPPVRPGVRPRGLPDSGCVRSRKSQPDRGAHRLQPGICPAHGTTLTCQAVQMCAKEAKCHLKKKKKKICRFKFGLVK